MKYIIAAYILLYFLSEKEILKTYLKVQASNLIKKFEK
jgi:hypothetical protein